MSKTIPAGTRKVILIDNEAAHRNSKRRVGRTEKVLRIIVEDTTGPLQIIKANTARCLGVSTVEYSQHGFVAGNQRAALVTTGEVVIDENEAEAPAEDAPQGNPETTAGDSTPADVTTTTTKPAAASKQAGKVKTQKDTPAA